MMSLRQRGIWATPEIDDIVLNLKDAYIKTAGAYVYINGLYPFAIGWKLHNGNIPVVRLGGHVEENETGWECAVREVTEEANVQIRPVISAKTYLVSAEDITLDIQEIPWEQETDGNIKPILVVAYHLECETALSLMYLAQSDEKPTPSAEVKGILLLDPESIDQICRESITLGQYLQRGGKAIFNELFDRERTLEPFIQLRILSRLFSANIV